MRFEFETHRDTDEDLSEDDLLATMAFFEDPGDADELDRLHDAGDWPGIARFYRRRAREAPDDPCAGLSLAETYMAMREYEKAIAHLAEWHSKRPELRAIRDMLLDALFESGAAPESVTWIEPPLIFDVATAVERAVGFFAAGAEPTQLHDLLEHLARDSYLWFKAEDLVAALEKDPRVTVDRVDSGGYWDTWIVGTEPSS